MSDVTDFHACCREVILAAKNFTSNQNLQYASTYAQAGLGMFDKDPIQAQIPYILTNLTYWRGKQAQEIKAKLRNML